MYKRAALIDDGPFDRGMAVAQRVHADTAEQVEVVVALLIDDKNDFASYEEDRIAFVGLQ